MVRLVEFAFALGVAIASGSSLRKRDILDPDAVTEALPSNMNSKLILEPDAVTEALPIVDPSNLTLKLGFNGEDLAAFWEGRDFPEVRLPFGALAPEDNNTAKRNVHVFGLQNSGTSLLKALLYTNFGHRLNYFDGAFTSNHEANKRIGLWTFASLQELSRFDPDKLARLDAADVYTISVVRSPYGWLQAVRSGRVPVLDECGQGRDWLVKPCSHRNPGGPNSKVTNVTFQNIAAVWSHWTNSFKMLEEFGVNHTLVVKYEELVQKPQHVLREIADYLELKKPVNGWTIPFEDASERTEPLEALDDQLLMEKFHDSEKYQVCHRLHPDVVEQAGYQAFDCAQFTNPTQDGADANAGESIADSQ